MPTRVRSYSKINLGLFVGPARPDGFHGLATVYQTLEAHDFVTVTARAAAKTSITLNCNHSGVPRTETGDAEKNTAYRIVVLALQRLGITAEVHIDILKYMPVQGGLGAGSANAAAALLALKRELFHPLVERGPWIPDDPMLLSIAAEVGSDVPLFLIGGTSLGRGRGEQVVPLPDLPATPCVLAIPDVGVSTVLAFRELDARMATQELTKTPQPDRLEKLSHALAVVFPTSGLAASEPGLSGISRSPFGNRAVDLAENPLLTLVRTGIENDFEEVAFSQHPSLRSTKRELMGNGPGAAIYAALSGSGSALFGLYASEADALAAQQRVQAAGTRAIVTKTLPRAGYWHTMFAE